MRIMLGMSGLAFSLLAGAALVACSSSSAPPSGVYESCSDTCSDNTACTTPNVATDGFTGNFCTSGCDATSANPVCPTDSSGAAAVCVAPQSSPANGICYAACPSSVSCPPGDICTAVINGAAVACAAAPVAAAAIYETCSGSCTADSTCTAANVTTSGFTGTFCTAACDPTNSPTCPTDGTGVTAVCVATSSDPTSGLCYAGCPSGASSECPGGETCGTSGGVNFCVP